MTECCQRQNADRLQAACFGRPLAVRYSDCDTRPPSIADFDQSDISSLVFVHYASVISIWSEIADFGVRGVSASAADMERLTDSLCTWIVSLPDQIRLFGPTGQRLPYRQSVSELHMVYFVTIILIEALRIQKHEQWSTSIASIIAASAVARLIEEVDCWEDLSSMSSTTTFYIMAASIPLIYHRPSRSDKKEGRQEELQILCSALEHMVPKWGGASVVRQNIEKIRTAVEWYASGQQSDIQAQATIDTTGTLQRPYRLEDMLPFPTSLCSNMDLLDVGADEPLELDPLILPLDDDTLPWAGGEAQSYLDFFRLNQYGDTLNLGEDSFGSIMDL